MVDKQKLIKKLKDRLDGELPDESIDFAADIVFEDERTVGDLVALNLLTEIIREEFFGVPTPIKNKQIRLKPKTHA